MQSLYLPAVQASLQWPPETRTRSVMILSPQSGAASLLFKEGDCLVDIIYELVGGTDSLELPISSTFP
jgi:hypothetical protein